MRRLLGTLVVTACAALLVTPPATAGPGGGGHGGGGHGRPSIDVREGVIDDAVSFRGLDAADRRTAWVSGTRSVGEDEVEGAVYRTHDGGRTWDDVTPPGADGLQFRDVEITGKRTVTVLAIGEGDLSRLYRTTDDGRTWTETYRADDARTFLDCVDFYPGGKVGLVMGDPVDGKFQILRTTDRGATWTLLPNDGMPAAAAGEAGFAASGDCLVVAGRTAYFGSGGPQSRIYSSTDRGLTWTATDSTIPANATPDDAAGVFGLAFAGRRGVAVGGNFTVPTDGVDSSAVLTRRGWRNGGDLPQLAEDAAFLPRGLLLATGESGDVKGTAWSSDGGRTWKPIGDTGFHTLDCEGTSCFAAGGGGRIAVATLRR